MMGQFTIINRKEYQQIPLRVEYSLTDMGKDLEPLVQKMYQWILKYNL